jgi:hypothetical protein
MHHAVSGRVLADHIGRGAAELMHHGARHPADRLRRREARVVQRRRQQKKRAEAAPLSSDELRAVAKHPDERLYRLVQACGEGYYAGGTERTSLPISRFSAESQNPGVSVIGQISFLQDRDSVAQFSMFQDAYWPSVSMRSLLIP